jgi:hypothetical protein
MFDRFGVRLLPRTIPAEAIEPSIRKRGLSFDAHPEIHVDVRVGKGGGVSLQLLELCWAEPPELLKGTGADALGWQDLVSSWAVDWHHGGVTFEPSWHSHRGRKGQGLVFETPPRPAVPGAAGAEVMVKVVSVFGDEVFRELRVP